MQNTVSGASPVVSSLVPMVIEQTPNGERAYDIYSRLLQDNIIMLNTDFNDSMAQSICSQILYLSSVNEKDINIYINSPGGSVTSGMAILDTARFVKNKINTICMGQACSMGAFALATYALPAKGGKKERGLRCALPNASIMIHQPLGGYQGQASDIEIHAKSIIETKEKLNRELSRCSNISYEEMVKATDRDNFMSAQDALKMGLIDKILTEKD